MICEQDRELTNTAASLPKKASQGRRHLSFNSQVHEPHRSEKAVFHHGLNIIFLLYFMVVALITIVNYSEGGDLSVNVVELWGGD